MDEFAIIHVVIKHWPKKGDLVIPPSLWSLRAASPIWGILTNCLWIVGLSCHNSSENRQNAALPTPFPTKTKTSASSAEKPLLWWCRDASTLNGREWDHASERPFSHWKHLVVLSDQAKAADCCAYFMNLRKSTGSSQQNCNQRTCSGFRFALDFTKRSAWAPPSFQWYKHQKK